MAVLTLPAYTPIYPATKTVKPRQRSTKLPSWGIEQRKTQGRNQTAPEWSLKWILSPAEANDLDAFLATRAKVGESFLWLPPSGSAGTFRCDDWTKQLSSCNIYEVQATFRQVFGIGADAYAPGFALGVAASFAGGAATGGTATPSDYYGDWVTQTYGFESDIYPSWWAN